MKLNEALPLLSDCTNAKELEGKINTLIITEELEASSYDFYKFFQHFDFLTELNKLHIVLSASIYHKASKQCKSL